MIECYQLITNVPIVDLHEIELHTNDVVIYLPSIDCSLPTIPIQVDGNQLIGTKQIKYKHQMKEIFTGSHKAVMSCNHII